MNNNELWKLTRYLTSELYQSLHLISWRVFEAVTWPPRKLKIWFVSGVDFMSSAAVSTTQKLLFTWSILGILALLSAMLYAAFYAAYVPTAEISKTINFSFRVCDNGYGICSFPTASVSFRNEGEDSLKLLGPGQPYSVELLLEVPDSHSNRDLGMFMVVFTLFDEQHNTTLSTQRSAIFKYRSFLVRILDQALLSPLYFLGLLEQKSSLYISLSSHMVDDYYRPSVGATVEIHSHRIEIYSGTLRILAKFQGLKYFLHAWPLLSAFCAFWVNLFLLAVGVGAVLLHRQLQQKMIARGSEVGEPAQEVADARQVPAPIRQETREQGCQALLLEEDEDDSFSDASDLPLVQEPADFPIMDEDEEILAELRHRRVH